MGQFKAGVWIMLIFVYFFVFIIIVNAVTSASNSTDNSITGSANFISGYLCDEPRYRWNPSNGESKPFSNGWLASVDCAYGAGVQSQTMCESISGCSWANTTDADWYYWWTFGLLGEETESKACNGTMTLSGVNLTSGTFGGYAVAPFSEPSYYNNTDDSSINLCRHPAVSLNQTACAMAGCTWQYYDTTANLETTGDIMATMGSVFSFSYPWNGASDGQKLILNFIFVLIPTIGLIISIYFSLPFLH